MLIVRIELIPMGDVRELQQLDLLTITNLDPYGDECRYEVRHGDELVTVQHDRRDGALVLAKQALDALLPTIEVHRAGQAVLDALLPSCEHVPFERLWALARALGDPRATTGAEPDSPQRKE